MILQHAANGTRFFHFATIPSERLAYGLFTRHGGVSPAPWGSLNFSVTVGDSAANVQRNVVLAHEALGLSAARMMDRFIAHSTRAWHVSEAQLGCQAPHADIHVTRTPALSLTMTFADCQPLLAYDPVRHTLAVAHAGWRGTLAGAALSLVRAMEAEGSRAADLRVGLGPAIGPCCYEVGPEVAEQARSWPGGAAWALPGPSGRPRLDLSAANAAILHRAGVRHIEQADCCTACHTDLFFSFRAEPPVTGRFALLAALRP